jgi:hypothetical protein
MLADQGEPIMSALIPLALLVILIAVVAVTVLSFTVHMLFSPWLLVALAILLLIKFRPRRSHR